MRNAPGFFDFDDRLRRLSDLGDQLEAYARLVDFEALMLKVLAWRLIRKWLASDAAAHEGARLREGLLDKTGRLAGTMLG